MFVYLKYIVEESLSKDSIRLGRDGQMGSLNFRPVRAGLVHGGNGLAVFTDVSGLAFNSEDVSTTTSIRHQVTTLGYHSTLSGNEAKCVLAKVVADLFMLQRWKIASRLLCRTDRYRCGAGDSQHNAECNELWNSNILNYEEFLNAKEIQIQ